LHRATVALETAISQRSNANPMTKTEAERFLMDEGLRRQEARNLLEAQNGHHWRLTVWVSQRGRPTIVVPRTSPEKNPDGGVNTHPQDTRTTTNHTQPRFPPCALPPDGGNHVTSDPHDSMVSARPFSADGQTSGQRKSPHGMTRNNAGENDVGIYAAEQNFSSISGMADEDDNTCPCVHEHVGIEGELVICLDCGQGLGAK